MADILYGRNAVREALRAGRRTVQRLLVSSGAQEAGTLGEVVKLAEKAGVPIMRNVELARGLHESVGIDEYITAEFFQAVAELLRWAESIRQQRGGG